MLIPDSMEVDKLRSRIEQQSGLICMLKQRADRAMVEVGVSVVIATLTIRPS